MPYVYCQACGVGHYTTGARCPACGRLTRHVYASRGADRRGPSEEDGSFESQVRNALYGTRSSHVERRARSRSRLTQAARKGPPDPGAKARAGGSTQQASGPSVPS
jgi:hypothetical protein